LTGDIRTVMWKEWKGLFRPQGSRFKAAFTLVVPVLMLAIFLPWQIGHDWVGSPLTLAAGVLIPLLLVGTVIPESFAGERERHTLETLLASRLPGRAILFGKLAVAVSYGWVMTIVTLLLGLVTVNVAHWDGQIAFYTPTIALANVGLSLLLSIIMASLGVLISLRSATVQGATQFLMAVTFFPLIVLQIAGIVIMEMGRDKIDSIIETLSTIDVVQLILIVGGGLIVVCGVLLWMVMSRFKRARLILS